jgi:hypothetical protein
MAVVFKYDLSCVDWKDVAELYEKSGLQTGGLENLQQAFSRSSKTVLVYDGKALIGSGRAVSDGNWYAAVCDIAVLPEYEELQIRQQISDTLMESCGDHFTMLTSTLGCEAFCFKQGFKPSNAEDMPMFFMRKDNEEAAEYLA